MKAYVKPNEVESMEKAATNLRDRLLTRIPFRTACRISETLALEVKDIDFDKGTITIKHLKSRIKLSCPQCAARLGKAHCFCPKCGSKVNEVVAREQEQQRIRTLPVDDLTLQMLKEYIDRGGPVERDGKRLIFGVGRGQAWRIIKECAERAGLGKLVNPESGKVHNVSPHRLRDAFAVNAVKRDDSGDGLRLLQEHLGHTSFNTTARYRKVAGDELKSWYDKLWEEGADSDGS